MSRNRRRRNPLPTEPFRARIESLDQSGRGVTHIEGKATFIDGALPGEEVLFTYSNQRKSFDEGVVCEILQASVDRVDPLCPHAAICGGCSLQHMASDAQIRAKQQILIDSFKHIGAVEPEVIMAPLSAEPWGYRRKARLGAKYVIKKEAMLVGFREKRSAFLAELTQCRVLHPAVGEQIMALRELLQGMQAYRRIPQVEVAIGDAAVALTFRILDPLAPEDLQRLTDFGEQHDMMIYLQPKGPETLYRLWPESSVTDDGLSYCLPEFDVEFKFKPTDFTQVNGAINRKMVQRAIELLDLQGSERVLDLFCGLGNFSLPLARHAASVVAVEGEEPLVQRGRENAKHNRLDNIEFYAADLSQEPRSHVWFGQGFDRILIDPPRSGALEIVNDVASFGASKIVYVSCNPATLARDAAVLVAAGYRLCSAGVMDMFPHTTHVESIALFERFG